MKRWAAADLEDVREVLLDRVAGLLRPGERLEVDGEGSAAKVHARVVLEGGAAGERVEVESEVELGPTGPDGEGARDLALDALDLVLLEYLESGRSLRLSGAWERRELRGQAVRLRAERTFPALDAQADALLGGPGRPTD